MKKTLLTYIYELMTYHFRYMKSILFISCHSSADERRSIFIDVTYIHDIELPKM